MPEANPGPGPSWALKDLDSIAIHRGFRSTRRYTAPTIRLPLFKAAGGKFLGYQGWSDASVVPMGTVDFYETVAPTMGGYDRTNEFFRFYAVPGMRHCSSDGDGADNIDS